MTGDKKTNSAKDFLKIAYSLDRRSRESEAIVFYKKSIKNGLAGLDLRDALVGLASSCRNLEDFISARRYIRIAQREFPNDLVVVMFFALINCSADDKVTAIRTLSSYLLQEHATELEGYLLPLRQYFRKI